MNHHVGIATAAPTMCDISPFINYGYNGDPEVGVAWYDQSPIVPTYAAGFNRYELYQNGILLATDSSGDGSQYYISGRSGVAAGSSNTYFVRIYDSLGRYAQSNTITIVACSQTPPTMTVTATYYGGSEPTTQVYISITASNGLSYSNMNAYCATLGKTITGANANPAASTLTFSGNPATATAQWLFNSTVMNHGYSWKITVYTYDKFQNLTTTEITNTI